MPAKNKSALLLARQLFQLSVVDGAVSSERVAGVLAYLEKHPPAKPLPVLKAYQRLIAVELAKSHAIVEHAGSLEASVLKTIAAAMTKRYQRPITASAKANPALIAGLRVHVGDDVYDSSVQSRLAALAGA